MKKYGLILFLVHLATLAVSAEKRHTARIVKYYGKVHLFVNPAKTKTGKGPFAKFNDIYYQVRKPKKGSKLKPYERIQTGDRSKVKLIYQNGDQITLSANTSYEVKLEGESGIKKPIFDMLFGKIRGLILKGGDRAGMKVRSSSMVMGVRGTDFYVTARGKSGASEISVIRGKVSVMPRGRKQKKSVIVPAGFSVEVPSVTESAGLPEDTDDKSSSRQKKVLMVKPTTKQKVAEIFRDTIIKKEDIIEETSTDPKLAAELLELERRAIENLKLDIKGEDPELYEIIRKIPPNEMNSSELIQAISTKKAFDIAPKAKKSKASYEDLKDLDVYDKYFR